MNGGDAPVASGSPETRRMARRIVRHVEDAEVVIKVLDEWRAELWRIHGPEIERRYHEEACRDAALSGQGTLDLDDPPF